jgi:hypothetical protein
MKWISKFRTIWRKQFEKGTRKEKKCKGRNRKGRNRMERNKKERSRKQRGK